MTVRSFPKENTNINSSDLTAEKFMALEVEDARQSVSSAVERLEGLQSRKRRIDASLVSLRSQTAQANAFHAEVVQNIEAASRVLTVRRKALFELECGRGTNV